jgi:uncharacterized protein YjbI with pentapeptide repeats
VGRKKLVRKAEPPSKRRIAWPRWTGFRGMTLRSWLELLVVPLALVVIGFLFSVQQDARQQRIEGQRARQAQKIENQRAQAERELAEQRAQDEALQAYLSQMNQLLLETNLRDSEPGSEVRILTRARTLSTLGRIDADHKLSLLQFLYEADLINRTQPIINLDGANLQDVDLSCVNLSHAPQLQRSEIQQDLAVCVRHYGGCNTFSAEGFITYALSDLRGIDLVATSLHGADLDWSVLAKANLGYADLSDANLHNALLADSKLVSADLTNADLTDANLGGANLANADLSGGAAMPGNASSQSKEAFPVTKPLRLPATLYIKPLLNRRPEAWHPFGGRPSPWEA